MPERRQGVQRPARAHVQRERRDLASQQALTGALEAKGGITTTTVSASGGASIGNGLTVTSGGLTVTAGGLNVTAGATSLGGTLAATGGIINTAIGAGGMASTGAFTTLDANSLTTTGAATIGNGLTVSAGGLGVTGNTTLNGTLGVSGLLTATGGLTTTGNITAASINVTGNATIAGGTLDDVAITDSSFATGTISGSAITGGTIDNAIIGDTQPVAGTFTALAGLTGTFGEVAGSTKITTPKVTSLGALALDADTLALNAKDLAFAASGGSNFITISTAGAERLRVAANGRIGIGTDNPTALLDVNGKFRAVGDVALDSRLEVTGVTTLTGALNANGGINTSTLTATGSVTASSLVSSSLSNIGALALTAGGTLSLAATDANVITASTNGLERLRIGADGRVLIGGGVSVGSFSTEAPTAFFDVDGSFRARGAATFDGTVGVTGLLTATGGIKTTAVGSDGALALTAAGENVITASTNGVERLRIGANGLVEIAGGATIGTQLQVNGAADKVGLVVRGATSQTANLFEIRNSADAALVQVTADGRMGIGTALSGDLTNKLEVGGNVKVTGDVIANNINQSSDARFKTNIQAIADALSIVRKLQGVSYDWNRAAFPDRGFSPRPQIGVLAQEVEKVLPELVSTDAQGYKSVNYTGFIPVLIEGMKQQADRLDEQDARLVTAEQTLAMVEERLFKTEEQVLKIDERLGQAEAFVARFSLTREPDTMVVLTPTFKVQNLTADRAYIAELRAQRIEAEKARFVELDADGAVIDSVDAARLRGRVVNTGGKELFVSLGTVAPLFEAAQDAHYIVSVTAEDGSFATAQVVNAGGMVRVVPTASQGIDVVANGKSVGLLAPSKKVKASWTRTG